MQIVELALDEDISLLDAAARLSKRPFAAFREQDAPLHKAIVRCRTRRDRAPLVELYPSLDGSFAK